ncbi:retrovirus-related pol polyprotein from transposon TNT 1-94 [Tanacetum coccineum]
MIPNADGVVNLNGNVKEVLEPLSKMTEDEYQGELQGDSQENKLTTAMMLLARAITQKFSTPTNNRLCTSSNTRNQAVIQDSRVDIQTKNAGYGGNGNKNSGKQSRNQVFNTRNGNDDSNQIIQRVPRTDSILGKANVQCYNYNERGHYARDCQKPRVCDAKYFREQILLAMKDEAGSNLTNEENNFMLDTSYGEETMEELTAAVMLMARIQPADGNAETVPSYDAKAVSEVNASSKVHDQMHHEKRKTIIQTSDDDQIVSNIIFDDPYVENNGGTSDHDLNDHDEYHKIQMLAYDVQREAENQKRLNNELKKQKMLLQQELETCKDRVKMFETKTIQCSKYKETCEELERELQNDKNTIDRLLKEKDNIQSDFFKIKNEKIIIQHETQLAKKAFKEREDRLGYKNPERLKKAIAAQPKMYDGEKLHSTKLVIDSPDSAETLEDTEESRLKMRNKMVQINYAKLNSLYETFVPQQDFSVEQTYFSIPSTFTNGYESKADTSDLPIPKMPKESKLLKMFDTLGVAINGLRTRIDNTLLEDRQQRWMPDKLKEEFIKEVHEMLNISKSMEQKVNRKSSKENILQNEIDRLLEVSLTSEIQNYVLMSVEKQKNEMLNAELERSSNDSKDIQANLLKRIKVRENDFKQSQAQSIDFELKSQHQKDKMACDVSWKSKLSTTNDENNVNTKFDKSETSGILLCVTPLPKNIVIKAKKVSNSKVNPDRSKPVTSYPPPKNEQSQKQNENVLARGMYRITKTRTQTPDSKTNINVSNSTGVESSNSVRRPTFKDNKLKNRVLKNTNAKSSTAHVRKMSRSVSIDYNKCETMNLTICHANRSVLNTKNVTAVNDSSNIICVSCGKDVFLLSCEKCVARYALSRIASVKRALFTTPIAAKSKMSYFCSCEI